MNLFYKSKNTRLFLYDVTSKKSLEYLENEINKEYVEETKLVLVENKVDKVSERKVLYEEDFAYKHHMVFSMIL